VASIAAQEIRVGNRIEFSNAVSLNAAIVQKILSRLQTASKDISLLQSFAQNDINALRDALKPDFKIINDNINTIGQQTTISTTDIVGLKDDVTSIKINAGSLQSDILNMSSRLGDAENAISDVRNLISSLNLADFVDLTARMNAAERTIININESLQILGEEINSVAQLLSSSIVIFK